MGTILPCESKEHCIDSAETPNTFLLQKMEIPGQPLVSCTNLKDTPNTTSTLIAAYEKYKVGSSCCRFKITVTNSIRRYGVS